MRRSQAVSPHESTVLLSLFAGTGLRSYCRSRASGSEVDNARRVGIWVLSGCADVPVTDGIGVLRRVPTTWYSGPASSSPLGGRDSDSIRFCVLGVVAAVLRLLLGTELILLEILFRVWNKNRSSGTRGANIPGVSVPPPPTSGVSYTSAATGSPRRSLRTQAC